MTSPREDGPEANSVGADHLGAGDLETGGNADSEEFARQILLRRLTDRPRSRFELAEWLAGKNVPDEIGHRLLDRFEELGLVDDAAFARMWVDSRQRTKGLARRALSLELRRKGIDDDTAEAALDELDPEAERHAARWLVQKKLRSMAALSEDVKTRRLIGMLGRKGYSGELAYAVVRDELAGG